MADKVIVLKDPFTGDRLFPVCSSKSIIDENGNSFDISKYLTQETASTLYAAKTHTHEIANINGLQTELDNLKTSVSEGKSLIAAAVTDKGVQTAADATFQQMATNIGNISTFNPLYNTIYGKDISISLINQSGQYANMLITIDDERLSLINPNRVAIIFTSGNTNIECIRYVTKISRYTCSWTYMGNPYGTNFNFSYGSNRITLTSDQFTYIGGVGPSYDNQCVWFAYRE